jgi:hypothetical protein
VAARANSRQYPTAYKLKAIKRAEGGEGVLPVTRKLGISRKLLHDWVKVWKAHRPEGLNRKCWAEIRSPASSSRCSPNGLILSFPGDAGWTPDCTPSVRHANFGDRLFFILGLGVLG